MIKWNDLAWYIKAGIVGGWIILIVYLIGFAYGFVMGIIG